MSNVKKSFVHGAMVLVAANAVVKIIGALYNIPLVNLIGGDGNGYYTVGYEIYAFIYVLSTAGMPVAVSKMVSQSNALGRYGEVTRIFRVTLMAFTVIGLIGACVMFFGAGAFARRANNDLAVYSVMAIAPAVFFAAFVSTFRGYSQGMSDMMPTAISQVIEAVCKLGVGFCLAYYLLRAGQPIYYVSAGAISGVTVGSGIGAVVLCVMHFTSKRNRELRRLAAASVNMRTSRELLVTLIKIAVPITIGASVMSLTNVIDLFVVMNRLGDIGLTQEQGNWLFGCYTMSRKLFNLPPSLIFSLSTSIMPVLSAVYAVGDSDAVRRNVESALRICCVFAIPAGIGLAALSRPILSLLYFTKPEEVSVAAPLLTDLGLAVIFVCIVSLTNAMLQAIGLINVPIVTMLIGGAVKLAVNYILVGIPSIGISGAPIGTSACYLVIGVLNLSVLFMNIKVKPRLMTIFVKPAVSGAVMGVTAIAAYNILSAHIGAKMGVLAAMCIAAAVYFLFLMCIRGFVIEDIEMLPKGEKLAAFLKKRGLAA